MWKCVRKFFSNIPSKDLSQLKMPHERYFPNKSPDYQGCESSAEVLQEFTKTFVEKIVQDIEKSIQPTKKTAQEGLYLGTTGISYMYYHLSKNPAFIPQRTRYLTKALQYLAPAIEISKQSSKLDIPSFILGNCGIYAVASVIYHAFNNKTQSDHFRQLYQDAANICKEPNFLNCGSDELFVGRAGYILGALWLENETQTELNKTDIYLLCNTMIESGRNYSQRHNSPCPLMYSYYQVEYLGAAHGLCSILEAILSVPGYLDSNPTHAQDVKLSIDYLLSLQDFEGNFPCALDELGTASPNKLVHWCHGAGGIIYLMAKAFLVFKDKKYLKSCEKMGDLIWKNGLLKKGPGICHGIAGNGYAFLLLHRLTQNPKYLYRGVNFAKFMQDEEFCKRARTPDYPFSLYEGVAGTACFLGDLLCPQKAGFPFSSVF